MMRGLTLIITLVILAISDTGFSQILVYHKVPHASTYHWSKKNRIQILDRSHSYDEGFFDRGFRSVHTPLTKLEYELDMQTYDYKLTDEFIWDKFGRGTKTNFGSLIKSRLSIYTEIYQPIELDKNSSFDLNMVIQEDGQAKRSYFEFGYARSFNSNHKILLYHNFSEFKKELDITLKYAYTLASYDQIELELTAQNYLNNFVNGVGDNTTRRVGDIVDKNYLTFPILITARFKTDDKRFWYLDLSGGSQPTIKAESKSLNDPDYFLQFSENLYYINSSISFRVWKTSLGGFYYRDCTSQYRYSDTSSPLNGFYKTKQVYSKYGLFAYGFFGRFSPHIMLLHEKYFDTQIGTDFSISSINDELDFASKGTILDFGSSINFNDTKLRIMFKYLSYVRSTQSIDRVKLSSSTQSEIPAYRLDNRFTLSIQATPHDRIFFEIGAGYDIDGDRDRFGEPRFFDKGFGKFIFQF